MVSDVQRPDPEKATPIEQLLYLMARLRDPELGCHWDSQQTSQSIAPFTLEEAYEVIDAIERQDYPHLREELGDLLLQIVFHAHMANEKGQFNFNDVVSGLVNKMVRRHPHVFPAGTLASRIDPTNRPEETAIRKRWDEIKQQEAIEKGKSSSSILGDIPVGMAPLKRAQKLQHNAAKVGFEWDSIDPVFEKLHEEIDELKEAIAEHHDKAHIEEEIGDVFLVCVNLCRHLGLDAEMVMKRANDKFENRFRQMEAYLVKQGLSLEQADLALMEAGWQASKLAKQE